VSDENASGTVVPPAAPATGGAFDWLHESHQSSAPMAPLTDDIPAPMPAPPRYLLPDPAEQPAPPPPLPPMSFPGLLAPSPAPAAPVVSPTSSGPPTDTAPEVQLPAPVSAFPLHQTDPIATPIPASGVTLPPVLQPSHPQLPPVPPQALQPVPPRPLQPIQYATPLPPVAQQPVSRSSHDSPFSFGTEPVAPSTFGAGLGPSNLGLERHETRARSGNSPLDWSAFVLAFLLPPIGLLLGIGAVVSGSTTRGYVASLAKAAIGIGAALTLVLGVAFAVVTKIDNDNAAHASIVASSAAWCTKLRANPAARSSDTLGWPSAGDTIPASLASIKAYESNWDALAKIAPAGIRADSQKVADTAKSIASSVEATQTLNDPGNVAEMQNVVATTSIKSWASTYCN
jgi:hypothetical protein